MGGIDTKTIPEQWALLPEKCKAFAVARSLNQQLEKENKTSLSLAETKSLFLGGLLVTALEGGKTNINLLLEFIQDEEKKGNLCKDFFCGNLSGENCCQVL